MGRKKGYTLSVDSEEGTVNITPLIDVVFVVLIMFIIIAPMLELDHVNLAISTKNDGKIAHDVQESSPITIHVREDNSVWIGKKRLAKEEMLKVFKEYKRAYPQKIPQLFHDRKAYFETYQNVKFALENAGFEEMDVILQPG